MTKTPTPVAAWPAEIRARFHRWLELTSELGIRLPRRMTISQWVEAHELCRDTYYKRRRKGRAPATVPAGERARVIPFEEWALFDLKEKLEEEAKAVALRPFQDVVDEITAQPLAPDYAKTVEDALEKIMPGATGVLDDVARKELSALAYVENTRQLTAEERQALNAAYATVIRSAIRRYQQREGGHRQ